MKSTRKSIRRNFIIIIKKIFDKVNDIFALFPPKIELIYVQRSQGKILREKKNMGIFIFSHF